MLSVVRGAPRKEDKNMTILRRFAVLQCLLVLGLTPAAFTQTVQLFQPFNGLNSCAVGISANGDIAGWYQEIISQGPPMVVKQHSYLLSKGQLTSFDPPDPTLVGSLAARINPRGDIVGWWWTATPSKNTGYLRSKGVFTNISFPGATHTQAAGINANGDIVGFYTIVSPPNPNFARGFILPRGGDCQTIELPVPGLTASNAWGINSRGDIVGAYGDPTGSHGFLKKSSGEFITLDPEDKAITGGWTRPIGINSEGEVSGDYLAQVGAGTKTRGFLWKDGVFTTYEVPDTTYTGSREINPSGWVVGCVGVTNPAPPPAVRNWSFIRSPR